MDQTLEMGKEKKNAYKGARIIKAMYFKRVKNRNWVFTGYTDDDKPVELFDISSIDIRRHTICKASNPYLPENYAYFKNRIEKNIKNSLEFNDLRLKLLKNNKGVCKVCELPITLEEEIEIHHILPKKLGGKDTIKNLLILHKTCHQQVTYNKDPLLQARYIESGIIKKN